MTPRRDLGVLLVLILFSIISFVQYLHVPGEDLSSSYVGCLVLAAGQQDHLYDHDTELFNVQDDPSWTAPAARTGFPAEIQLHPYVQTPLWAFSLRPLCTRMNYPAFNRLFLFFGLLSFAGTIWLLLRYWTPLLFHPGWAALLCLGLALSEPFRYAMFLNQTHILFVALTVAALVYARRYPVLAGILLSVAAAVKITPGFLLVYWLLTRRHKAALSFVLSSTLLAGLTYLAVGPYLVSAYLGEIRELSDVLLVAFNNQSFAAWSLAHRYPPEPFVWRIYHLGPAARFASVLLCLGSSVLGGLLDRSRLPVLTRPSSPPYGAVFAMLGATMSTPIAWTHYFILLLLPVTFMLEANRRRRSPILLALVAAVFLLNLYPISVGSVLEQLAPISVVRSQWYAGLLCLVGLVFMHLNYSAGSRTALEEQPDIRAASPLAQRPEHPDRQVA